MNYITAQFIQQDRQDNISDALTQKCLYIAFIARDVPNIWDQIKTNNIDNVIYSMPYDFLYSSLFGDFTKQDIAYGLICLYGNLELELPK